VSRLDDGALRAIAGPDMIVIRSDVELRGEGFTTVADFTINEGERASFVMTWGPSHLSPPTTVDPAKTLEVTSSSGPTGRPQCTYRGAWREAVIRSLLTLKALTFQPTGGIVAAPTTSLPEQVGGVRNWGLPLLLVARRDTHAARPHGRRIFPRGGRLARLAAPSRRRQPRSGPDHVTDWAVNACCGSGRSLGCPDMRTQKPVRVGNAAHEQLQLDVYGEVMDALHQARLGNLAESAEAWALERALVKAASSKSGKSRIKEFWETRGAPQHFTHSKVMAWVAIDRAVKSAEQFHLDGPIATWRALRDRIHADVCEKAYNADLNSFVQAYGSKLVDASVLLMPLVGFLPPDDPRIRGTVEAIEKRLVVDGFVLRYDSAATDDGLPEGEGPFSHVASGSPTTIYCSARPG